MKKLMLSCLLSMLFLSVNYGQYGTDRTGYEGDNFSLEGALDLFKESRNLREFERKLNTEDRWVNNLDLNYDGRADYIRVEHRRQRDYHAIILQALVDRRDFQDVAVIEIEVTGRREAVLQIIGDEDLYGQEVIVEPVEGYSDNRRGYDSDYGSFVNVYYWPAVQHILGRQYQIYVSPYRWQYYPTWWSPWRQCTWNVFRPRIVVYQRYYNVVRIHRVIRVHNFYRPYRAYSYNVLQRSNNVRRRQGRAPIQRQAPAVQQNRRPGTYNSRNTVVGRSERTTRPNEREHNPSVSRKRTLPTTSPQSAVERTPQARSNESERSPLSRKRTLPATDRDGSRDRTPRANPRSRDAARSPRTTPATTPTRQSPARSRNTAPRVEQKPSGRTMTKPGSQRQPTDTRVRSNTPARQPSARPQVSRNTTPKVNQRSRSEPARTSPRTAPSTRKPAASSGRSTPTAKPKVNRSSSSPRRSSSSSRSRSRKGGGE